MKNRLSFGKVAQYAILLVFSVAQFSLAGCAALSSMVLSNNAERTMMMQPEPVRLVCPPKKVTHSCYVGYDGGQISFPETLEPSFEDSSKPFWADFQERMEHYIRRDKDKDPKLVPEHVWNQEFKHLVMAISTRMDIYEKLYIRETCVNGIVQSNWDAYAECKANGHAEK